MLTGPATTTEHRGRVQFWCACLGDRGHLGAHHCVCGTVWRDDIDHGGRVHIDRVPGTDPNWPGPRRIWRCRRLGPNHRRLPGPPVTAPNGSSDLHPTIHVTGWLATSADPDSVAVDSDDFLVWWLPVFGPTAAVLAHRLARYASIYGPVEWATDELTRAIGIVDRTARLHAAISRLERFLLATASADRTFVRVRLTVRRPAPNPPHRQTSNEETT